MLQKEKVLESRLLREESLTCKNVTLFGHLNSRKYYDNLSAPNTYCNALQLKDEGDYILRFFREIIFTKFFVKMISRKICKT